MQTTLVRPHLPAPLSNNARKAEGENIAHVMPGDGALRGSKKHLAEASIKNDGQR